MTNLEIKQIKSIIEGESNKIANYSNISALLNEFIDDINWVGFYFYDKEANNLVLGPFQGKVACMRIPVGKGVCGTAFDEDKILRIENVHEFAGHIACDSASNSEIVLPIHANNEVIGVLDIDSPTLNRFSLEDQLFLEKVVNVIESMY